MAIENKIDFLKNIMEYEGELTPETVLSTLDCWDSITKLSLIIAVEDDFHKELSPEIIKGFITVGDILIYLDKN